MKKNFTILMMLFISKMLLAQTATPPSLGDGSSTNPYQIATLENLYWIAANTANWNKHYIQTANINAAATNTWFSGQGWTPIGNSSTNFTGTYNGNNFTISNLWINRPATQYQGLFGYTNNSTIKSLTISNLEISGGQYTGGLTGRTENTIVEIVNVSGEVSSSGNFIGGMIGYASNGQFHYLSADVTVTGAEYTGGLIGYQQLSAEIRHSWSDGSVTGTNNVGGLVGWTNNAVTIITDCFSHCNVSGNNKVGGFVGQRNYGNFYRSFSTGSVTGSSNVGGFIGGVFSGTTLSCYWDTQTSGQAASAGGTGVVGKTTAEMKQQATFPQLNFATLWEIEEGVSYPEFQDLTGYDFIPPQLVDLSTLSGSGTAEAPYIITNANELHSIRQNLAAHYKLDNNIDMSNSIVWNQGRGWAAIGSKDSNQPFTGVLDGDGYKITGLHMNVPYWYGQGLFSYLQNSYVKNIELENFNIHGSEQIGILVGYSENSNLENICVSGQVVAYYNYTGGIAGFVSHGGLHLLTADVIVNGGTHTGGLIGSLQLSAEIRHSWSTGSVTGTNEVGGLVGRTNNPETTITDCYSHSNVSGNTKVGGFVGQRNYGNIYRSFSTGSVSGSGSVGGFIGSVFSGSTYYCYWDTQSSGQATSAGETGVVGKTTAQMKQQATFPQFNFATLWEIEEGVNYPVFQDLAGYDFTPPQLVDLSTLSGSGTAEAPYIITNADELHSLRQNLAAHYKLGNNINLSNSIVWNQGRGWATVASKHSNQPFTGVLDGDGYKITGLQMNVPYWYGQGFFSYLQNATVKNLEIENVNIHSSQYTGVVAGYSESSDMESVSVSGQIVAYNNYAGGITGFASHGLLQFLSADVNLFGADYTGGLIGHQQLSAEIRHSFSKGSVTGTNQVGGLVGRTNNPDTFINDCYSLCSVFGNSQVGGFVGYRSYGDIQRSYCTGNVTGVSSVGGFIGNVFGGSTSYSYWDTQTSGQATSAGGAGVMGRTTAEMTHPYAANTYQTWDFTDVWQADQYYVLNNGYPYLAWQTLDVPAPVLSTPANNSINISLNPTLQWQEVTIAQTYGIQVSTTANFSVLIVNQNGIVATSYALLNLSTATQYYWRANATVGTFTSEWSEVWSFTTLPALPTLTTTAVSNISQTTATSGGNISSDGGGAVTARGVVWSTSENPTITSNLGITNNGSGTGSFTSNLTGLNPFTTYYVRAYATNSAGTAYGSQQSFTTLSPVVLPTLTTTAVSNISQTTASSGGNISSDGGGAVTARGVVWSTSENPTITSNLGITNNGSGTGSFTSNLTGLNPSTTYYVRAYATNSAGTAYGSQQSFGTLSPVVLPTLTTSTVSSITQTTATSGGNISSDGGGAVTARGVVWSTSENPTIISNLGITNNGSGTGSFTSNLTGLNPSTTYYVRAYATNSAGTAYGNEIQFMTLDAGITGSASFAPGPLMNIHRMGHTAITLPDGRVGFFGGHTTSFVALKTAEIWVPGQASLTTLTMNYFHSWPAFVVLNDGRYLIAGGCKNSGVPNYATSEIFNPATTSFNAVGSMVRFRSTMNSGGAAMTDGKVLIASAWWTHNNAHTYGELFNPASNNFSAVGPFSVARSHAIVMPTADGKAVVLGGGSPNGSAINQIMELYNPANGSISTIQNGLFSDDPDWRVSSNYRPTALQKMNDGRYIWLAGKSVGSVSYRRLLIFDPLTKEISHFETNPPLPNSTEIAGFYGHPVVDNVRGRVHLVATIPGSPHPNIVIFSVDLFTGILTQLSNSYNPGYYINGSDVCLLNDGRLMISGGSSGNNNSTPVRNTLLIEMDFDVAEYLPLNNYTIVNEADKCFEATGHITTSNFVVEPGNNVSIVAGNSIRMLPGTIIKSGAYLHAWIDEDGSFCNPVKPLLVLDGMNILANQDKCFAASETIEASNIIVQSGATATLVAGQNVKLLGGTRAHSGSYFHVWIDPSGNYCNQPAPLLASEGFQEPASQIFDAAIEQQSGLKIYPNPTTGHFILEFTSSAITGTRLVEIYSMMGELILSRVISGEQSWQFDLADRAKGIYIVRVVQGREVEMRKVVKQ